MKPGETLQGAGYRDWLPERHGDIEWRRWIAYKQLLTGKGFTPSVQTALDGSTDEILNCLGDPNGRGSWKRRGLVIGDVQSGKTATYIGAVNKAADAGYKLIILLAGGTEALRKQTQFRVDEGLIGRDSSKKPAGAQLRSTRVFGVGNWLEPLRLCAGTDDSSDRLPQDLPASDEHRDRPEHTDAICLRAQEEQDGPGEPEGLAGGPADGRFPTRPANAAGRRRVGLRLRQHEGGRLAHGHQQAHP